MQEPIARITAQLAFNALHLHLYTFVQYVSGVTEFCKSMLTDFIPTQHYNLSEQSFWFPLSRVVMIDWYHVLSRFERARLSYRKHLHIYG